MESSLSLRRALIHDIGQATIMSSAFFMSLYIFHAFFGRALIDIPWIPAAALHSMFNHFMSKHFCFSSSGIFNYNMNMYHFFFALAVPNKISNVLVHDLGHVLISHRECLQNLLPSNHSRASFSKSP
jgi:hypothetical protein